MPLMSQLGQFITAWSHVTGPRRKCQPRIVTLSLEIATPLAQIQPDSIYREEIYSRS
jgi:hypothetical protein